MSNEVCKNIKISKDKTLNNLSLEPEYNACSIKDKIANNNNVEIIDDKIIEYKEKIYLALYLIFLQILVILCRV